MILSIKEMKQACLRTNKNQPKYSFPPELHSAEGEAMAEVVTSSLLRFVSDQLSSKALSEFALLTGVDKELKKLRSTLSTIHDVLEDAEMRQQKDRALRGWLRKLKDLAYDADDVLDDFATRAAKLKPENEADMKEKVHRFLSYPKYAVFLRKIALRVKEINGRLDEIAEERSKFHLNSEGIHGSLTIESGAVREETGSFINESEVYGRQEEKEKIIEFLMSASIGGDVGVMAIVGLGGLGKTTVAQLVYNDERVCNHFEKRIWVCVSEDFEIRTVVRLIIESVTGSEFCPMSIDAMQASLTKQLWRKRYLLVLDNVWSESHEKWDSLRNLLAVGAEGSKVIVTTRNERVASIMGTIHPHHLLSLSLDDCWLLFERRAFGIRVERNLNLVAIGKDIVKRCGGVPLAAKALGSLLRFKRTESEWLAIKESELWKFSDDNYEVLPALKLSYDHLSSGLKQCFAYCSIFPKDYEIDTDILVQLWSAEGFLQPSYGEMQLEQMGFQYVDELLARSLFQMNMEGKGGVARVVKMHDLIHDLARSVAGDDCSIMDATTERSLPHNSRYASFICEKVPLSTALQTLRDAKKLRTLYLQATKKAVQEEGKRAQEVLHVISSSIKLLRALHLRKYPLKTLPDSFKKLQHLRYLDLSHTPLESLPLCITTLYNLRTLNLSSSHIESVPDSIGDLQNLCTLNLHHCSRLSSLPSSIGRLEGLCELDLSFCQIKSLPESICALSSLHTLGLRCSYFLHELPQNMSNMKSLVHLDIYGCVELTCIPRGLGKLNRLRTLPIFFVGGKTNCTLAELSNLNLEGELHIKKLQNVRRLGEGKDAQLKDKHHIRSLKLSWELQADEGAIDDKEVIMKIQHSEDLLQSLQPSRSLRELGIEGYIGTTFPPWMMELLLENLVCLTLTSCVCGNIPALGQLPKLEVLNLISLPLIKHMCSDFYGGPRAFPSLQELELNCLTDLEEWCSAGVESFLPCLQKLTLLDCPKLKALPSDFPTVTSLNMKVDDKLLLSSLQNGVFPNLKHMRIENYDDEDPVPEVLSDRADSLTSWSLVTKPKPKDDDPTIMSSFGFGMAIMNFEDGESTITIPIG